MKKYDSVPYILYLDLFKKVGLKLFKKYSFYIRKFSNQYNVNPELLFGIIISEQVNRGDLTTRILEKIAAVICKFVKLDISLGLGQIKISTAQLILDNPVKNLAWKLTNPVFNLECLAMLINKQGIIYKNYYQESELREFIFWYTTGKKDYQGNSLSINIYYKLVKWCIDNEYFKKLEEQE